MKIANGHAYGDSDWHDLLTELNDTPIVYEGQTYDPETNEVRGSILSGNPKYYNGWNFDWQRGRELASAEQTDGTTNTTLTYAYDADGIRTSKTYKVETYETRYTVTFIADSTTVKTMTVADGYTLKTSDYPTVPAKSGYTGSWQKYTAAIHANITIEAVYEEIVYYTVRFVAQRVTVKTMTVEAGYILQNTDYPDIPQREGYTAIWGFHAKVINKNTTITAQYTKTGGGGGDIPIPSVRPTDPWEIMSEDLPEPIEPQDVIQPDDTTNTSDATGNTAEPHASHPGQVLVSSQTVTHEYLTLSGKVAQETVKVNGSVTEILDFIYDESGRPFALIYRTDGVGVTLSTYYYVLNLQGDVVKLVNPVGTVVASYEYDAWGNILSKAGTMADKNPLRYRGYYYDTETGFYYLQSRYYDPTMRRFLNADTYASTGLGFIGTNMFAYCNNNPINFSDYTGRNLIDADTDSEDDYTVEIEMVMGVGMVVTLTYSDHTATILYAAEHHKRGTTNKANLPRHQKGQRRKKQDAGGEKGDTRRPVDRSNKKHFESQRPSPDFWERVQYTIFGIGCFAGVAVLVVDDLVPGGQADDQYIVQIAEAMEMYFSFAFS